MSLFNRVSQALAHRFVEAGRTRARRDLLARSDRFLIDNGFSRELLNQGNDTWPWRFDGLVPAAAPRLALPQAGLRASVAAVNLSGRDEEKAVAELGAMSDAELSDLGIARAGIREAVRNGRPDEIWPIDVTYDRMVA